MNNEIILKAILVILAAIICVPIAKRAGFGSVLGYLVAGILVGPFVLDLMGNAVEEVRVIAEFGVVMMLFLIGLELDPKKLWQLKTMIFGAGLSQMLITSVVLSVGVFFYTQHWPSAIALAMALSMSSTAIGIQSLKEKRLLNTRGGLGAFGILLFQDIAVIPILAVLPFLAPKASSVAQHGADWFHYLPNYLVPFVTFGAVALVVVSGRYLVSPLLRQVSGSKLRELFIASALLIVVVVAYIVEQVGLSPALGAFVAGVTLANSAYKHELESDIEPFKGLFLGLFFITVGISLNFSLFATASISLISITLSLILVKFLIIYGIGKSMKMGTDQSLIMASSLAQVGEFAFVLLQVILQVGLINQELHEIFIASTAMSMMLTPFVTKLTERLLLPRFGVKEKASKPAADTIEKHEKVILAGFSHFGSTVGRFLRANGIYPTILDHDPDRVELLRRMGFEVYYGDATRLDLLISAGAFEADYLLLCIDSPETNMEIVKLAQKHFPKLNILVRVPHRFHAYDFMELGVQHIYRETLETSVKMGSDLLVMMGRRKYSIQRKANNFIKYDNDALKTLKESRNKKDDYIASVRKQIDLQETLIRSDMQQDGEQVDHAWDSEYMRQSLQALQNSK